MSEALATGLAASANEPVADSSATPDSVLDAAFAPPSEPAASSETPTTNEPAKQPVAATQPPPDPTKPEGVKGTPPEDRWPTILDNARKKAREDALAEHREHLEVVAELKRDYPGTLARLLEEAAANPQFSEAVMSKAAALLNARKQAAKADSEPQPDAVTRFDDGTQEPSYSPAQQRKWLEWRERQMKSGLLQEFKPLLEMKQQLDQHAETQKLTREAISIAEERGATWKAMPFFADHKDAILARQQEIYAEAEAKSTRGEGRFDPVNTPWLALQQAYSEIVTAQAIPKLQSQQTDNLVAVAARKRAGSASDPAASAPAQPRQARTVDEALDQAFEGLA